jgi:hypothetical protein
VFVSRDVCLEREARDGCDGCDELDYTAALTDARIAEVGLFFLDHDALEDYGCCCLGLGYGYERLLPTFDARTAMDDLERGFVRTF